MTVKELIEKLQELDPTGEITVMITVQEGFDIDDIHYVEHEKHPLNVIVIN